MGLQLPSWIAGTIERPSPSDIVPTRSIVVDNSSHEVEISFGVTNLPFVEPPEILPVYEIPDSNSMDGVMDAGNNPLYIRPSNINDYFAMWNWLEREFKKGYHNDCVYRIMVNEIDKPDDFTRLPNGELAKPHKFYAIHRIVNCGWDKKGRWWHFKGFNNPTRDPFTVRDRNILWLNAGVIY